MYLLTENEGQYTVLKCAFLVSQSILQPSAYFHTLQLNDSRLQDVLQKSILFFFSYFQSLPIVLVYKRKSYIKSIQKKKLFFAYFCQSKCLCLLMLFPVYLPLVQFTILASLCFQLLACRPNVLLLLLIFPFPLSTDNLQPKLRISKFAVYLFQFS